MLFMHMYFFSLEASCFPVQPACTTRPCPLLVQLRPGSLGGPDACPTQDCSRQSHKHLDSSLQPTEHVRSRNHNTTMAVSNGSLTTSSNPNIFTPPSSCSRTSFRAWPYGYDVIYTQTQYPVGHQDSLRTYIVMVADYFDNMATTSCYPNGYGFVTFTSNGTPTATQSVLSPATCPHGYTDFNIRITSSSTDTSSVTVATCCPSYVSVSPEKRFAPLTCTEEAKFLRETWDPSQAPQCHLGTMAAPLLRIMLAKQRLPMWSMSAILQNHQRHTRPQQKVMVLCYSLHRLLFNGRNPTLPCSNRTRRQRLLQSPRHQRRVSLSQRRQLCRRLVQAHRIG